MVPLVAYKLLSMKVSSDLKRDSELTVNHQCKRRPDERHGRRIVAKKEKSQH